MTSGRPEPSWQRENVAKNIVYNDPLAVIYNEGQWRLSRVSPLYNLQYDVVKLKQYASKVRQVIISGAITNSAAKYMVKFEEQPNLKYSENDSNGLMITISSSQEDNSKDKVVYTAILLSWGVYTKLNNTTHLPYMVERGELKIGTAVKIALKTIFDCNIIQFCFTQHQMLQIGLGFLESDTSSEQESFVLVYEIPDPHHKNKLTFSFKVGDVKIIWNGVKAEVSRHPDQVSLAYQMLQNQIYFMINLDTTPCKLCEVILPKSEVKNSGVLRMKTPEIVNCVFSVLNEFSRSRMKESIIEEH